jgi:regulator of sigma E protease
MDFLYYPIAFLVVLGVLVTFHEFGHYIVARWSGVHVVRFSVGFGRALWSKTDRHGTEFTLAAIPLGGYVRMYDDRDPQEVIDREGIKPYMALHPGWRIAIALGGPVANLILAVLISWGLFVAGNMTYAPMIAAPAPDSPFALAADDLQTPTAVIAIDGKSVSSWQQIGLRLTDRLGETGAVALTLQIPGGTNERIVEVPINNWHAGVGEPDVVGSLGLKPVVLPIVGQVVADSPAAKAGLQTGDWVTHVDAQPVADWREWVAQIEAHPRETVTLTYVRNNTTRQLLATPDEREAEDGTRSGFLGVGPALVEERYGVFEALPRAIADTWDKTLLIMSTVKKIITGNVSVKNLSGPISIAQVAGDSAQYSWRSFMFIMAFLSVSLGVFNLLPIPILDGGQVVFNAAELVTGKPVPERIQIMGVQVGLFLVGCLFVFATYNDFLRLF